MRKGIDVFLYLRFTLFMKSLSHTFVRTSAASINFLIISMFFSAQLCFAFDVPDKNECVYRTADPQNHLFVQSVKVSALKHVTQFVGLSDSVNGLIGSICFIDQNSCPAFHLSYRFLYRFARFSTSTFF